MPNTYMMDHIQIEMRENDEEERIERLIITPNKGGPVQAINCVNSSDIDEAKSAISAFMDYNAHGLWDGPGSSETVFIRTDADLTAFYAPDVGYITELCDDPKFPLFDANRFPGGVANLARRLGRFHLAPLSAGREEIQERYAQWLVWAAQGGNLDVRVLPFSKWAEGVLENLSIKDREQRLEDRANRYAIKIARDRAWDKGTAGARTKEEREAVASTVTSLVMPVFNTGEMVDMMTVSARIVKVHTPRGRVFTFLWNGDSVNAKLAMRGHAVSGNSVEL